MKTLLCSVLLVVLVVAIYIVTWGKEGGVIDQLPARGDWISERIAAIDP